MIAEIGCANEYLLYFMRAAVNDNEAILCGVESLGGGYVWEAEVFAVTLLGVPVNDDGALSLCNLVGVQQIAVEPSALPFSTLQRLALIPGLESLVLNHALLTPQQEEALRSIGPEIELVTEAHET